MYLLYCFVLTKTVIAHYLLAVRMLVYTSYQAPGVHQAHEIFNTVTMKDVMQVLEPVTIYQYL